MALLMENREIMELKDKFLQTEQRNNSLCCNERELICRGEGIGIFNIHSAEISIQLLCGCRLSFGIRSFIFYISLHLFYSHVARQSNKTQNILLPLCALLSPHIQMMTDRGRESSAQSRTGLCERGRPTVSKQ